MEPATLARVAAKTGLGPIATPTGIVKSASGDARQKRGQADGASKPDPEEP